MTERINEPSPWTPLCWLFSPRKTLALTLIRLELTSYQEVEAWGVGSNREEPCITKDRNPSSSVSLHLRFFCFCFVFLVSFVFQVFCWFDFFWFLFLNLSFNPLRLVKFLPRVHLFSGIFPDKFGTSQGLVYFPQILILSYLSSKHQHFFSAKPPSALCIICMGVSPLSDPGPSSTVCVNAHYALPQSHLPAPFWFSMSVSYYIKRQSGQPVSLYGGMQKFLLLYFPKVLVIDP